MNHILSQHLDPVARRYRVRQVCTTLAICWLVAAIIGLTMLIANRVSGWYSSTMIPSTLIVFAVSTLLGMIYCFRHAVRKDSGYRWIAAKIENQFPELDSSLMTAIEQQPAENKTYGFLQQEVIRSAVYHDLRNRWANMIPGWHLLAAPFATFFSFMTLVAVLACLFFLVTPPKVDPNLTTFGNAVFSGTVLSFSVEPGNTDIEKGKSVLVLARFDGRTPPNATLNYADAQGNWQKIAMTKSLEDPVFAARMPFVESPVDYYVQLESQRSDAFRISVFEYPKLKRADAKLTFPEYTEQPEKIVQDFRRLSAVEGTMASLTLMLNKSVASAVLVDKQGESDRADTIKRRSVALFHGNQASRIQSIRVTTCRFRRTRKSGSPSIQYQGVTQSRTENKNVGSSKRSPGLATGGSRFRGAGLGRFRIKRTGLVYMIPGKEPVEQILANDIAGKLETSVHHLMEFERLEVAPDQLLSYYFWAEDMGPDGKIRRTAGDMYFAEVRPFEEIFRQGQQPDASQQQQQQQQQQQSQQNAQQAEKLAELQKQVINATWKLIRTEGSRDSLSDSFEKDVELVSTSQQAAIQQVEQLAEQLSDPRSSGFVTESLRT